MTRFFSNLFSLLFVFSSSLCAVVPVHSTPTTLIMNERKFTLSTYYDVDSDFGPLGNVIKSSMSLRTSYEYYDIDGVPTAKANLRIFSLGSLFTWAGVMDIYDIDGERLGIIDGAILTFSPSKFNFYNRENQLIGIAYMDKYAMGFTVCDPNNSARVIATFQRQFVRDVTDHWVITINDPLKINLKFLIAFGAFVVDNQGDFRIDD